MAGKGDKGFGKPNLSSNPFSLPVTTQTNSSSSPAPMKSQSNTAPKGYSAMTSYTTTLARNLFSGSSAVTSATSSVYPVTSLQSNTFGGSAFKGFDSRGSFGASTLSKPSVIFGVESGVKKSSTSTYPVFGGGKTTTGKGAFGELANPLSTTKYSDMPGGSALSTSSSNVFGASVGASTETSRVGLDGNVLRNQGVATVSSVFGGSTSAGIITMGMPPSQVTPVQSVFGELPSSTLSGFNAVVSESASTCIASPSSNIFGGTSDNSHRKTEKSRYASFTDANVFGGVPGTVPNPSTASSLHSNSGQFVTSGYVCTASGPTLFGGASSTTAAKTSAPSTTAPVLFGGISSVLPPSDSSQNVHDKASKPMLFGGLVENSSGVAKTTGSFTSSSSVFGGIGGNSTAFSIAGSSVPSSFGELTSVSFAGGITGNKEMSLSNVTVVSSHVPSEPPPPYHAATTLPHLFGGTQESSITVPEAAVSTPSASVPSLLGGGTSDLLVSNVPIASTVPNVSGESSCDFLQCTSSEGTKAIDAILDAEISSSESKEKDSASTSSIFGGITTDSYKAPKLFGGDVFCGKQTPQTTVQSAIVAEESSVFISSGDKSVTSEIFESNSLCDIVPDDLTVISDDDVERFAFSSPLFENQDHDSSTTVPVKKVKGEQVIQEVNSSQSQNKEDHGNKLEYSTFKKEKEEQGIEKKISSQNEEEKQGSKTKDSSWSQGEVGQGTSKDDSSVDQKSASITESKEERDKESHITDLMIDIFGKDEAKLSPPSTAPSTPEKKELTKIIIAQIPESCMDKDIIKRHFQKFGHVKRVFLNPRSNQATVQYEHHRGASKAKRKGQKIHPKLPDVKIFYAAPARRKSEDSTSDAMLSKRKAIKTLQHSHPTGDIKAPSDLDPYTPLDRPELDPPGYPLTKPSRREEVRYGSKTEKVRHDDRTKARISKPDFTPRALLVPRVSRPIPRSESTKTRIDSPKSLSNFTRIESPRSLPKISHVGSPKPISKSTRIDSPKSVVKITRIDSPKSAKLKQEGKAKTTRSVSPAREYSVFTEIKDLKATMESRAVNSNDKYNILKARDKLIRNEKKRTLDIRVAAFLDATCPDMCPELERYMREVQNEVSSFEVTDGELDHRLVIKKFSRSSADKEEPLPHELRPGPVLLRTMDFLVCNIIVLWDRKDIDRAIWYNYLWDRTRAVRNDITQQQLTDGVAVTIIERCVRFHIYTAVHLCEESSDVFDRKLNTENLTKSMQTLKELYKDLAEMGKYFQSEAEFRAYEMLLHLNDGEKIVHQYSQYKEDVQKSSDVIYALKVFWALKSNNYARFFKLIKSGSYLQGCVLHRYFQQVRSKALDTFIKAYGVSKQGQVCIPLVNMIKTLGFEDKDDAKNYLNYHGIKVDDENVILDKNFIDLHPEGQPPIRKPMKLIESNRLFSVGEVIQGGPMPENPLYSYDPHDSFDNLGYLKVAAKDASDQRKKLESLLSGTDQSKISAPQESRIPVVSQPMENVAQVSLPPVKSEAVVYEPKVVSDHDFMAFLKDTYDEVTTSVVSLLAKEVALDSIEEVGKAQIQRIAVESICKDLLSEFINREGQVIVKDACREVEREEVERKRRAKEVADKQRKALQEMRHHASTLICSEYTAELLNTFIKQICQESVNEVKTELWYEARSKLMKELPPKLILEVIQEESHKLCTEVISEMTAELEGRIQELQQKILLRKIKDHFRKWRKIVLQARRRKQSQASFPACCSQLSLHEQNQAFSWGYSRKSVENLSAEQILKLELDNSKVAEKMIVRDQLVRAVAWYPLPLQQEMRKLIENSLQPDNVMKHYFKLLLCTSPNSNSTIIKWLRSKLNGIENGDNQEPLDCSFSFKSKRTGLEYGCSIREASSKKLCSEDINGTSAVLFITNEVDSQCPGYVEMQNMRIANPNIPFRIISEKESPTEESLVLREENLLATESSQKLMNVVLDLWNEHGRRLQIVSRSLNNFVSGFVASSYIKPSLLVQRDRHADRKSPLMPQTYIDLYNEVICFLINIVQNEVISTLDWPPLELSHLEQVPPLTWNKSDIQRTSNEMEQMKLPVLEVDGFMTWKALLNKLYSYIAQVSHPEPFSIELWSRIYSLLNNTLEILESVNDIDLKNQDFEIHMFQLPWTEFMYACISFKLNYLTDKPVYYQPKTLQSFTYPQSWWTACDYSDPFWNELWQGNVLNPRKRMAVSIDELPPDCKVAKLSSQLLSDIAKEKEKSELFQKKLESYLEDDDDDNDDDDSALIWNETVKGRESLDSTESEVLNTSKCEATCQVEELGSANRGMLQSSELLCDIAKEKQKHESFLKRLENMLEEANT